MKFRRLTCRRIPFREAAKFYSLYEHLGNPGLGVYHWAAFYDGKIVAAVSFGTAGFSSSRSMLGKIASAHGLRIFQLTRGGTLPSAPRGVPSWTVSQGLRAIRKLKGECLIAAYSDPTVGEIGTIYQACNFFYLGMTNPKNQSVYVIHGKKMSAWVVRRTYGTRCLQALREIDPRVKKIPLKPKYRYVIPSACRQLKRRVSEALQPYIQAYPKRNIEGVAQLDVQRLVEERKSIEVATSDSLQWSRVYRTVSRIDRTTLFVGEGAIRIKPTPANRFSSVIKVCHLARAHK